MNLSITLAGADWWSLLTHFLSLSLLPTAASALLVWRTRLHMLWLLGAGGVLGWLGWV
ncbi:MAG: hypothetical protein RIR45_1246 [Pseudomonadota bacterium]